MIEPARQLYENGEEYRLAFDYAAAQKNYLKALEILLKDKSIPHPESVEVLKGKILNALGLVCIQLGDTQKAVTSLNDAARYFNEALTIQQSLKQTLEQAYTLNNLGMLAKTAGDFPKAQQLYQQAYDHLAQLNPRSLSPKTSPSKIGRSKATILNNLSAVKITLGDPKGAIASLKQALAAFEAFDDKVGIGQTKHNLGYATYRASVGGRGRYQASADAGHRPVDPPKALDADAFNIIQEHYLQALAIRRDAGDKLGRARTLNSLGCLYGEYVAAQGADPNNLLAKAVEYLREAHALFEALLNPTGLSLVEESYTTVRHARRRLSA